MLDIRDRTRIDHGDVVRLNFIKDSTPYVFRRHHRQGLRSHVMEVLFKQDITREIKGVEMDGIKWFPRARPLKMLRIFRKRFHDFKEAFREIIRLRIIETYLAPNHMALSNEFFVDYPHAEAYNILLCGLQEFIGGELLDPWGYLGREYLLNIHQSMTHPGSDHPQGGFGPWCKAILENADNFINRVKDMAERAHYIPDLAGVGNIIITPSADIKLVDINNISKISLDSKIYLDGKGYPVCDKSIEALWRLETYLLNRTDAAYPLYRVFLDPERMKEVEALDKHFHASIRMGLSKKIQRICAEGIGGAV
jgi:hypothetical protein